MFAVLFGNISFSIYFDGFVLFKRTVKNIFSPNS